MNPLMKKFLFSQVLVFLGALVVAFLAITVIGIASPSDVQSTEATTGLQQNGTTINFPESQVTDEGFAALGKGIGAGIAVGFAGVGAGIGLGTAGAAAIGAITEKPEIFGKSLIFVVFVEAIAIYGLVISFLLI